MFQVTKMKSYTIVASSDWSHEWEVSRSKVSLSTIRYIGGMIFHGGGVKASEFHAWLWVPIQAKLGRGGGPDLCRYFITSAPWIALGATEAQSSNNVCDRSVWFESGEVWKRVFFGMLQTQTGRDLIRGCGLFFPALRSLLSPRNVHGWSPRLYHVMMFVNIRNL